MVRRMARSYPVLYMERAKDVRGGGQVSLVNMLKHIDRNHFKPYFVCSSEGGLIEKVRDMGIESEVIETKPLKGFNLLSLLSAIKRLSSLINKWGIRIIHSNAGATRDTLYGGVAAKLRGIPFVWHVRAVESGGVFDRVLSSLSSRVIVISKAVERRFCCLEARDKIEVIHNGLDLEEFRLDLNRKSKRTREGLGISQKEVVIGTVGQLIPWKGHRYLIEAVKSIKERVLDIKLLIVGEEVPEGSGYRRELEDLTLRLGLKDDVVFTGFREDIPSVMTAIDIFVLPSIDEAFGRVLIEAMAMEKPVVATNGGGVPEVLLDGETGILVPSRNPEALADAVLSLLMDRERALKMGKAGRERVEKFFTIEQNVKKTQELYLEILKK